MMFPESTTDENSLTGDDLDDRPSKSQRKRESTAQQELGEKLVALAPDVLKKMPLDEQLLETLLQTQKMTQREARRRHLQRVGKLMRNADVDAIQLAYDNTQSMSREAAHALHELEHWRARLLREGDSAVGEALQVFPGIEAQPLRQLIRDARRETEHQKAPVAARKLFQYLKSFQLSAAE